MKSNYKAFATALSLLSSSALSRSYWPIGAAAFTANNNTRIPVLSTRSPPATQQTTAMSGWSSTWKDILNGGSPRWKITSGESHEKAYALFRKHVLNGSDDTHTKNLSVLCPLAGDDPFVRLLYNKGYSVTAIDLVEEAIDAMRQGFVDDDEEEGDGAWTRTESGGDVVWTHRNGRATLIVGDALKKRPNLNNSFDAVYDKDSFGALPRDLRKPFCERIAEYIKDDGILYLECKLKQGHAPGTPDDSGPPFSLRKEDLMQADHYGGAKKFEYVEELGPVYDLPGGMGSWMQQTGHVLRRRSTRNTIVA